jgi:hypothetical protein
VMEEYNNNNITTKRISKIIKKNKKIEYDASWMKIDNNSSGPTLSLSLDWRGCTVIRTL